MKPAVPPHCFWIEQQFPHGKNQAVTLNFWEHPWSDLVEQEGKRNHDTPPDNEAFADPLIKCYRVWHHQGSISLDSWAAQHFQHGKLQPSRAALGLIFEVDGPAATGLESNFTIKACCFSCLAATMYLQPFFWFFSSQRCSGHLITVSFNTNTLPHFSPVLISDSSPCKCEQYQLYKLLQSYDKWLAWSCFNSLCFLSFLSLCFFFTRIESSITSSEKSPYANDLGKPFKIFW